jgi:murein DD-endopeptidase MepM/ murein hydrolase activator NlpD
MAVAVKPSQSLINIRSGIKSVKDSFSGINKKTGNVNNILLKKTKVKRESIARNYVLSQRRQEAERRKNREDLIEASSIGGVIKRQGKAVVSSTKGFLGRIMDFLGTLLIGWLAYNLPSIITMAQELIARMQRLATIVSGFFNNTTNILKGFGNLLGAAGKNILTFDFTDSSGRVKKAMSDLNINFNDMQSQFDEGFRLLTTSLGEGVASGEDAQPFGTEYPNQSFQETSDGGGEEETKGGRVSPQAVYSYLKSKGMSDNQALGITANIKGESKFQIGAQEKDDTQSGVGLFQYSNVRKPAFLRAVPNYKTNWKGQIDYAINEDRAPEYLKKQFSSPEEAAYWWMNKWERPADRVYKGRNEEHNAFIKSFKPGSPKQAQTTQRSSGPAQAEVSTSVIDQFKGKPGGSAGEITSERGMRLNSRTGRYRMHEGIDIAPAGPGYYVAFKQSGKVSYIGWDQYGYGNYVDIKSGNTTYRFAHLAKVMVKNGQSYTGQTIGEIGTTGGSTGIHLHFEVRPGGGASINPRPYLNLLSIGKQLSGSPGKPGKPPAQTETQQRKQPPKGTPAQIASQGTQQRQQVSQQLAQQRNGPTVVVMEEEPPPQQQVSAGGGGGGIIPIIINPLNSFITKKLLLDLAYT